jgi:hypothetical protein
MSKKTSTSLVPSPRRLPAVQNDDHKGRFKFGGEEQRFVTREDVRKFLPDILGRVLARIWIDADFHAEFSRNPQKSLENNGVFLPENMTIDFQRQDSDRPRIVVFEQRPGSKFKMRVFYLQLVMMAGR